MLLFKKLISPFLFPMPLTFLVIFLGLLLLWLKRRHRIARWLITGGVVVLYLLSCRGVADRIIRPLERAYPPRPLSAEVAHVVVLGGGHICNPDLPTSSQINASTLVRLVEGIRQQRQIPGAILVLSGGRGLGPVANAEIMAAVARDLGVSPDVMILEAESRDTKDEARLLQPILGSESFLLVTSAAHMPRAMRLFEARGMHPLPVPTRHLARGRLGFSWGKFWPEASQLRKSERAIYEFLGIAWARLRGQI